MIDRKQLMVGNLVMYDGPIKLLKDTIVVVEDIGDDGINIQWLHEMTGWEYDYEHLFPIELTPEWLNKFNFKTPDNYQQTVLYFEGVMIDIHMGKYKLRDYPRTPLNYVHQLQNLYYALTGEELTIKSFNQSN